MLGIRDAQGDRLTRDLRWQHVRELQPAYGVLADLG